MMRYFYLAPLSLALPKLTAKKSITEYTLARTDPSLGVGVKAENALAAAITAQAQLNHAWSSTN